MLFCRSDSEIAFDSSDTAVAVAVAFFLSPLDDIRIVGVSFLAAMVTCATAPLDVPVTPRPKMPLLKRPSVCSLHLVPDHPGYLEDGRHAGCGPTETLSFSTRIAWCLEPVMSLLTIQPDCL